MNIPGLFTILLIMEVCKGTITSNTYGLVSIPENYWEGLIGLSHEILSLTKDGDSCPFACTLVAECMGYKSELKRSCSLGKIGPIGSDEEKFVPEFAQGTCDVVLKKDLIQRVQVDQLVSFYQHNPNPKPELDSLAPANDKVAKLVVPQVPTYFKWGAEVLFVERYRDGLMACGGLKADRDTFQKTCWSYRLGDPNWTDMSKPMLHGHGYGAATYLAGRIYAFAGTTDTVFSDATGNAEVFDGRTWREIRQMPAGYEVVGLNIMPISDHEILLVSGKDLTGNYIPKTFVYDTRRNEYLNEQPITTHGVNAAGCAVFPELNAAVCVGGCLAEDCGLGWTSSAFKYDLDTRTWTEEPSLEAPYVGKSFLVRAVASGSLYLVQWDSGNSLNQVYEYNPAGPAWAPVARDVSLMHFKMVALPVRYTRLMV